MYQKPSSLLMGSSVVILFLSVFIQAYPAAGNYPDGEKSDLEKYCNTASPSPRDNWPYSLLREQEKPNKPNLSSFRSAHPLIPLRPKHYPKKLKPVMPHEESPSCCSDNDLPISKEEIKISRMKFPINGELRRSKRFPIHLDPLFHYRSLARSGQCPKAKDGLPTFYCPTPDRNGNWRCIDDFQLCDRMRHCPNGEDEHPISCLFYRSIETNLWSISHRP